MKNRINLNEDVKGWEVIYQNSNQNDKYLYGLSVISDIAAYGNLKKLKLLINKKLKGYYLLISFTLKNIVILINENFKYSFYYKDKNIFIETDIDFRTYFFRGVINNNILFLKNYRNGGLNIEYYLYDIINKKQVFNIDIFDILNNEEFSDNSNSVDSIESYFTACDNLAKEIYLNEYYKLIYNKTTNVLSEKSTKLIEQMMYIMEK
jgi:hypothetical protein